jgi:uncharacterized protein YbaP (TraB family)
MTHSARARYLVAIFVFSSVLIVSAAAQTPQRPATKGLLWKIQASAGSTPVYLAGSVHALTADAYPLSPAFERAFDGAGTLVEEIDLGQMDLLAGGAIMFAKGFFDDGRTFERAVSKETLDLVGARLGTMGVPVATISPMKPWTVAMMLMAVDIQSAGFDPGLGLDKYFYDKATRAGKPVKGLETIEEQVDRLDRMPLALQEKMLRSTLHDIDTGQRELKTVVKAWRKGDSAALERILLPGFKSYPDAYASLVVERNRNWLGPIDACLTQRSVCFVVVGAAHLVGPDGLIALLQRKGYRVEQQ